MSSDFGRYLVDTLFDGNEGRHVSKLFETNPNMVAFFITTLLDMSVREQERKVKISAMNTLIKIIHHLPRTACAHFLPGIVSSLAKILLGDFKQGHKVMCAALDTLTEIVLKVLNDEDNRHLLEDSSPDPLHSLRKLSKDESAPSISTDETPPSHLSPLDRPLDRPWLLSTTKKLDLLIQKIFSPSVADPFSSKWRFRSCMARSASSMVLSCQKVLRKSLNALIDILVLYSRDHLLDISNLCTSSMRLFSSHLEEEGSWIVKESLYRVIKSLPRSARTSTDSKTLIQVRMAIGYLSLLKSSSGLSSLINTKLHSIMLSLFQVLELNTFDIGSQQGSRWKHGNMALAFQRSELQEKEDFSARLSEVLSIGYPRKIFRHFLDYNVAIELLMLCRLFGYYGDFVVLCDYCISVAKEAENAAFHRQAILNEMILGTAGIGIQSDGDSTYGGTSSIFSILLPKD